MDIIEECYNKNVEAGVEYFVSISVNNLQNGMYLCVLSIGDQTKTAKLIVAK